MKSEKEIGEESQNFSRYEDEDQTLTLKADWIISAFGSTLLDGEGLILTFEFYNSSYDFFIKYSRTLIDELDLSQEGSFSSATQQMGPA